MPLLQFLLLLIALHLAAQTGIYPALPSEIPAKVTVPAGAWEPREADPASTYAAASRLAGSA